MTSQTNQNVLSNISSVGVVGCGLMGSGIAEVCARAGLEVVVAESSREALDAGHKRLVQSLDRAMTRGKLSEADRDATVDRIVMADDHAAFERSDLIIEAVNEDEERKVGIFRSLDAVASDSAILASNTSSIPIMKLAMATSRPEQVIGMHFFNPVPVLPLLEVVTSLLTGPKTTETAVSFGEDVLGKRVIRSQDRAGFIVNALLIPYLLSAIRMLESGFATAEDIDVGMVEGCAHPMGPLALTDLIGLDTTMAVAESLYEEFKEQLYAPPPLLNRMVDAGLLGRKAGRGFYDYAGMSILEGDLRDAGSDSTDEGRLELTLTALGDAGLADLLALEGFAHIEPTDVDAVVAEFVRFCDEVVAPTDREGDRIGCSLDPDTSEVTTPPGFKEAYEQFVAAGWASVPFDLRDGGGGFPKLVGVALQEVFASANLGFSLGPALTQSAIELLSRWGDDHQRRTFLPRLMTGEWNGTMLITEPDAGSDVGAIRTSAARRSDGRWEITGTKIFISWGEHDLTDNIVHLVLARTEGSPQGTKGLSLFVVPKVEVSGEAKGERNRISCVALERKMGLHASPTCVMELDGAAGDLVGEEHGGIQAMFSMMNPARLAIGLQGLSVGEAAFAEARVHSADRVQGAVHGEPATVDLHPDVRRMLALMRSSLDAMRLVVYETARQSDLAQWDPDPSARERAQAMVDLLTPVAKAWVTDLGVEMASLGVQVQGGSGYIEDSTAPQRYRDSRIAPIYEGTNGIQAIDLAMRKIGHDDGRLLDGLFATMDAIAGDVASMGEQGERLSLTLADAVRATRDVTAWMIEHRRASIDDVLAGATPYLQMLGDVIGGWLLARRAVHRVGSSGAARALAIADFYAVERLALVPGRAAAVTGGVARLFI